MPKSANFRDVLVYGGGMLGRQVSHLVSVHFGDAYRVRGFVDDAMPIGTTVVGDIKTVGSLGQCASHDEYSPAKMLLVFGIGYSNMAGRRTAFDNAKARGYEFLNLVHPRASVEPSARLGEGVVVLAGAIVDQYVTIGAASYLHIGSKFGEGCVIGANNYFSAGATFGGSVQVGDNNFFGINATIVNDIKIGSDNFVNADSLVYRDVADSLTIVEYREQREVGRP